MSVKLVWATPNGDDLIAYMARVSNPKNQGSNKTSAKLIQYLIEHNHWSPFEMVNACLEIETTRDITRQILRHRSFSFQEFSQRYANVSELPKAPLRETRMQDVANRQNSTPCDDATLTSDWAYWQQYARDAAQNAYDWAIGMGIAKEQARVVLPEGLTNSRMYMNGTLRSWIHFYNVRSGNDAQKEVRDIANQAGEVLANAFPLTWKALTN